MNKSAVWPGCDGFEFLNQSKVLVLMIHGFTSTPQTMRGLGLFIADSLKFDVIGLRLPGHATNIEDLRHVHAQDYLDFVSLEYERVQDKYECIHVVGLSFGGMLSQYLAQRYDIQSLTLLAPFYEATEAFQWGLPKTLLISIFNQIHLDVQKSHPSIFNQEAQKKHQTYETYPVDALEEFFECIKVCKKNVEKITCPIQIIHGLHDSTSGYAGSEQMMRRVSSSKSQLICLKNSDHIITEDNDKEYVFDCCLNWLLQNQK